MSSSVALRTMQQRLTILVPVFNEEKVIPLFFGRLKPVLEKLSSEYVPQVVFIDNCSIDGTREAVADLRKQHADVFLLSLSKNCGYQRSLEFGLRNSEGDIFVFIDVDCEDPPEMILEFIAAHKEGYDVVYGERVDREEAQFVKTLRKIFYRITRAVADEEVILDMAEFSLITSEVRAAIIKDSSSFPFIRASIGRVGFKRKGIPYKRHRRIAGETHYNFVGMATFAVAGILSSSTLFLRLPIYLLPVWLVTMTALVASCLTSPSAASIALLFYTGCLYIGTTLAFLSIYLARVYKNTLGRPNAIMNRARSLPQQTDRSGQLAEEVTQSVCCK